MIFILNTGVFCMTYFTSGILQIFMILKIVVFTHCQCPDPMQRFYDSSPAAGWFNKFGNIGMTSLTIKTLYISGHVFHHFQCVIYTLIVFDRTITIMATFAARQLEHLILFICVTFCARAHTIIIQMSIVAELWDSFLH